MNINNLRVVLEKSVRDGQKIDESQFTEIAETILIHQPYVSNVWYALEPAVAQSKSQNSVYGKMMHKNIKLLNTEEFSEKENLIKEPFADGDYSIDPAEIWYHTAKKPGLQVTNPYFDEEYMKVIMYTMTLAIHDKNGWTRWKPT